MENFEKLEEGQKVLFEEGFYSGQYDQDIYIRKAIHDNNSPVKMPIFFISAVSMIDGHLTEQAHLYFYLDEITLTSYQNIGSFLISYWINLCLKNGYEFLETTEKQKKPFLLYLLKTYGFEVSDLSLYETRPEVISICKSLDPGDSRKFLLFKNMNHEIQLSRTNVFKEDNYEIIHDASNYKILDCVLVPLQGCKKNPIIYKLQDYDFANEKSTDIIEKHRK